MVGHEVEDRLDVASVQLRDEAVEFTGRSETGSTPVKSAMSYPKSAIGEAWIGESQTAAMPSQER